jgi:SAM-dependent methyltransferase
VGAHAGYHLGNTDAEHDRLIRQGRRLAPITERFFRDAGIAGGHRVLDLGVGDVAMLLGRIVGPRGHVVAVERDTRTIARARARIAESAFQNIDLVAADVDAYAVDAPVDAVVGRYILQFLPDPVTTLRKVTKALRPGGIVAFQEGSWAPFLALSSHLPLWFSAVSLLYEAGVRSGVNLEMGPALYRVFLAAGLPPPQMRLEMALAADPEFVAWTAESLRSVYPRLQELGLAGHGVGDLETLDERLRAEVAASQSVVPWIGLVGAWSALSA